MPTRVPPLLGLLCTTSLIVRMMSTRTAALKRAGARASADLPDPWHPHANEGPGRHDRGYRDAKQDRTPGKETHIPRAGRKVTEPEVDADPRKESENEDRHPRGHHTGIDADDLRVFCFVFGLMGHVSHFQLRLSSYLPAGYESATPG